MSIFGRRKQAVAPKVVPPWLRSPTQIGPGPPALLVHPRADLVVIPPAAVSENASRLHPGWTWSSSEAVPDAVVCCADSQNEFLLIAMWNRSERTDIGLFPLGSGDDPFRRCHWSDTGNREIRA
jgi:hypothetical protein